MEKIQTSKCPVCGKVLAEWTEPICGIGSANIHSPCRCCLEVEIFKKRLEACTVDLDPAFSKLIDKHFGKLF